MYFADLVKAINVDKCIDEFLARSDDAHDINRLKDALYQMIEVLKSKKPNYTDNCVIHIGHAENEDESYDYAYLLENNNPQVYSFEVVPWDDVLGYALDAEEFEKYDKEYYAMLILWEITWFGYDEETIQNKMKSWNDEDLEN